MTDEEYLFLDEAAKCAHCGHSSALHNGHCCEVPGCTCEKSPSTNLPKEVEAKIVEWVQLRRANRAVDQ